MRRFETPYVAGIVLIALALFSAGVFAMQYFALNTPPQRLALTGAAGAANSPFSDLEIGAKAVYVLDLKTGKTLYERNSHAQLPLASITKVPLAIAVAEVLSPSAAIKIPRDTSPEGSQMRLAAGDVWQLKDVLDFTLIASSNGGADILAEAADPLVHSKFNKSPQKGATLWRMNDLTRELGLNQTYFLNNTGLDESGTLSGAYGSAQDVARLFQYASERWPAVFAGTARDGLLLTSIRGGTTNAYNTNDALGAIPGLIMGKTGYTDLAGGNLAIVYDVGPAHPVVAVVLGSTEEGRFEDMKKIVSATYTAIAQ